MFWFPLSFPWQTLFTFFYEHLDWKQTGGDWPNSAGLYPRIGFIKRGSEWLETIYSYLRTHGLGTYSQWPPGVGRQRCIVKTKLLHKRTWEERFLQASQLIRPICNMFLLSQDSNVPLMRQFIPHFESKTGQMIMACLEGRTWTLHKLSLFYVHLCVKHEIEPLDLLWLGFSGFSLSCDYLYLQKFFQSQRGKHRVVERNLLSAICEKQTSSTVVITTVFTLVYTFSFDAKRLLILFWESWTK